MIRLLAGLLWLGALSAAQAQVTEAYEALRFISGKDTLPYRLLTPEQPIRGQKYPLVVFLHGSGERGRDNQSQLAHVAWRFTQPDVRTRYPAYVVFPQCPADSSWSTYRRAPDGGIQAQATPTRVGLQVLALIDRLEKDYAVDRQRIYLCGLSMGGFGVFSLVAAAPQRFAAAVPVCGGGQPDSAPQLRGTPFWVLHGQEDPVVPLAQSARMVQAMRHDGQAVAFTVFPGVQHDSWTAAFGPEPFLYDWLFAQRRP